MLLQFVFNNINFPYVYHIPLWFVFKYISKSLYTAGSHKLGVTRQEEDDLVAGLADPKLGGVKELILKS